MTPLLFVLLFFACLMLPGLLTVACCLLFAERCPRCRSTALITYCGDGREVTYCGDCDLRIREGG